MDEHQPVDPGTIPHHDSGYFPGMTDRFAWAFIMAGGWIVIATILLLVQIRVTLCWLGLHGSSLRRISSNTYHIDYRCADCGRGKTVFRR